MCGAGCIEHSRICTPQFATVARLECSDILHTNMFRIVFHLTVIGILLAVDLNHLHPHVVVVADQLRASSGSYVDLDADKPGRACCRCPLSDAMELVEETMTHADEYRHAETAENAVDVQTALRQRFAEPDLGACSLRLRLREYISVWWITRIPLLFSPDLPSIYRMGFFWKARMCCDCVDPQTRLVDERQHEWNRL